MNRSPAAVVLSLLLIGACGDDGATPGDAGADALSDAPVVDGPILWADAPRPDAPAADAPAADAPAADAPAADAPAADARVPDANVPDAMVPDAALPDAAAPDAALPDAAAPDAAAPDAAPPDAGVTGVRFDPSYALACGLEARLFGVGEAWAHPDGTIRYIRYAVIGSNQWPELCTTAGAVVPWSGTPFPMSWWVVLDDARLVVASTLLASTQVLTPTLTVAANLPAFPSMSTAVRANGQLDLASGSSASVLRYDASTYVAGAPVTATSPTRTAWSCGAGSPYLLTRKGDRLVRVTAATWQDDPTFGVAGQVAIPTGALLAVDAACRFAFITPGATTTITAHASNGQPAAPITIGFVTDPASAARYDTAGRLVVSSTDVADELRLARVDLAASGLDPSFGTAGIARLDVPGLTRGGADNAAVNAALLGVNADGSYAIKVYGSRIDAGGLGTAYTRFARVIP